MFEALARESVAKMRYFSCQDASNLVWACATLQEGSTALFEAVASDVPAKLATSNFQDLSNIAWAFAALGALDSGGLTLLRAIAARFVNLLSCADLCAMDAHSMARVVMAAASVAWAIGLAAMDSAGAAKGFGRVTIRMAQQALVRIGQACDKHTTRFAAPLSGTPGHDRWVPVGEGEPRVMRDLPDRLVILKPPGWEVDDQEQASCGSVTKHLRACLLHPRWWPLVRDQGNRHGFLHRLDIPSSGLILAAKSYSAYYDALLQLWSGNLRREYMALLCGWAPPAACRDIRGRVHAEDGLSSRIDRFGRPSLTLVKVVVSALRVEWMSHRCMHMLP